MRLTRDVFLSEGTPFIRFGNWRNQPSANKDMLDDWAGTTTNLLPTNIQTGQTIKIQITQNATPSTLTYDSAFKFPGGVSFTISSIAGDVDVLTIDSLNGTTLNTSGVADFK